MKERKEKWGEEEGMNKQVNEGTNRKNEWTNKQANDTFKLLGQTGRQTDRQTDKWIHGCMDRQANGWTDREVYGHADE